MEDDDKGIIWFRDFDTNHICHLPRGAIAVVHEVKGVTITVPARIAKSRGLV